MDEGQHEEVDEELCENEDEDQEVDEKFHMKKEYDNEALDNCMEKNGRKAERKVREENEREWGWNIT